MKIAKKLICIFIAGLFPLLLYPQREKLDSLMLFLKKSAKEDTTVAKTYNTLGKEYEFVSQDSAVLFLKKGFELSKKLNHPMGQAMSYIYFGYIAEDRSDFDSARTAYHHAYDIFKKLDNKAWQAEALKLFGEVEKYQGNLKQALNYYIQALELYELVADEKGVASLHYSMGGLYMDMGRNEKALETYEKGYELDKKLARNIDMANDLTAIGIIYDKTKRYKEAKKNYAEAKLIYEKYHQDNGLSNLYTWMAITAYNEKDIKTSLEYFQQSLKLYEKINNINGLMYVYNNIGSIYAEQGQTDKAIEWQSRSLEMSLKYGVVDNIRYAYEMLAVSYAKKGDYKNAYESFSNAVRYKDSIMNEATSKQLAELDKKFESAKKDKELIQKDAALVKQSAETEKQTTQRNYFILGFLIMLILVVFVYRGYRQKQKANEIIAQQKLEVEIQKNLIEEKQKEIVDSINYAQRLQQAILPPLSLVKNHFPEGFIFYQPKDIVAGDFYWMEQSGGTVYFAAADCTGHGVPGAMVSVVCSNALNRTVKEFAIKEPGKILEKVRDLVIETFEKSESEVKDGMDISLCALDRKSGMLLWAGANNPLWIVRNKELIEYKATKQPIGKSENPRPFETHSIQLQKEDMLYLFTDGYPDQFGGPQGKKFKYAPLQKLLVANSDKSMNVQEKELSEALISWKGKLEQVDDILVMGFRI